MEREIICIVGRTGQGKSLLARVFAHAQQRLFVYDPMESYDRVHFLYDEIELMNDVDEGGIFRGDFRVGIVDCSILDTFGSIFYLHAGSLMVLEEFSTIHTRGQLLPPWLARVVFMGRHRALSLIVIAQRANSIPIEIRSQVSRFITFSQHEPDDLGWLRTFFTRDQIALVPQLPVGWCIDSASPYNRFPIHRLVQQQLGITLSHIQPQTQTDLE